MRQKHIGKQILAGLLLGILVCTQSVSAAEERFPLKAGTQTEEGVPDAASGSVFESSEGIEMETGKELFGKQQDSEGETAGSAELETPAPDPAESWEELPESWEELPDAEGFSEDGREGSAQEEAVNYEEEKGETVPEPGWTDKEVRSDPASETAENGTEGSEEVVTDFPASGSETPEEQAEEEAGMREEAPVPETGGEAVISEPEEEGDQEEAAQDEVQIREISPEILYATNLSPTRILQNLDFSAKRIFVGTEDESIFTDPSVIVSSCNGLYLLQFENEETAKRAYVYYYDKAELVDVDNEIQIAEDGPGRSDPEDEWSDSEDEWSDSEDEWSDSEDERSDSEEMRSVTEEMRSASGEMQPDPEEKKDGEDPKDPGQDREEAAMTPEENPFTDLAEMLKQEEEQRKEAAEDGILYEEPQYDIALLDTGVSEESGIDSISLIGESAADDNGHGTAMAQKILEQNPDARILSIKVLDSEGRGDLSAVYAGLEYAFAHDIPLINLSMSARESRENGILEETIRKHAETALVVGAAGNNGKDARYYVPGRIPEAMVTGACDGDGVPLPSSNQGETVDVYTLSDSTSEAAAILSGWLSANGLEKLSEEAGKGLFFLPGQTGETNDEEAEPDPEEDSAFHATATTWDADTLQIAYSGGGTLTDSIDSNTAAYDDLYSLITKSRINGQYTKGAGFSNLGYDSEGNPVVYWNIPYGLKNYANSCWIKYETPEYDMRVQLMASYSTCKDSSIPTMIRLNYPSLYVNPEAIYSNAAHTTVVRSWENTYQNDTTNLSGRKVFVGLHVDVYKHGTTTRISLPKVYSMINDIDEGQSVKRINESITGSNSFVRTKAEFNRERDGSSSSYKVKYNSGNVYSPVSYTIDSGTGAVIRHALDSNKTSNLISKTTKLGTEGLDYSFGFVGEGAASDIAIFANYGNLEVKKNTIKQSTGSLKVTNSITSSTSQSGTFRYTATFSDTSGTFTVKTYNSAGTQQASNTSFQSGGTFDIPYNGYAVISKLPAGTTYTITQSADANWTPTPANRKVSGTIPSVTTSGNNSPEFTFKVNFKEGSTNISGLKVPVKIGSADATDMTTNSNGNISFQLHGNQKAVISKIPSGYTYTVSETAVTNYTTTSENASAKVQNETTHLSEWTNTYNPPQQTAAFSNQNGSLQVSKTVVLNNGSVTLKHEVSGSGAPASDVFTYRIGLSKGGSALSGSYNYSGSKNGTVSNGGSITLTKGQSVTIAGLPAGTTVNAEQTLPSGRTGYYVPQAAKSVSLSGGTASSFRFTVNLKNGSANASNVPVTCTGNVTGTKTTDSSGNLTFDLAGGQNVVLSRIPAGYTYTVSETSVSGYTTSKTGAYSGTVSTTQASCTFTNTFSPAAQTITFSTPYTQKTGSVTLRKTVTGRNAPEGDSFTFLVNLKDNGTGIVGSIPYSVNGVYKGTVSFTNGNGTLQLKGGETAVLEGISQHAGHTVTYSVTESAKDNYVTTSSGALSGGMAVNSLTGVSGIELLASGAGKNADCSWSRAVTAADTSGVSRTSVSLTDFPVSGISKGIHFVHTANATTTNVMIAQSGVPLENNKTYEFSLWAKKAGTASARLMVPLQFGSSYETGQFDLTGEWKRYSFEFTTGQGSAVLPADGTVNVYLGQWASQGGDFYLADMQISEKKVAAFQNEYVEPYDFYDLTIKKNVSGNMGDRSREFTFTVELSNSEADLNTVSAAADEPMRYTRTTDDGTETGTVFISGGKAQFRPGTASEGASSVRLSHGDTLTITNIPQDKGKHTIFRVSEAEAGTDGYVTTVTGRDSGTLEGDTTVQFNNRRNMPLPTGVKAFTFGGLSLAGLLLTASSLLMFRLRRRKYR